MNKLTMLQIRRTVLDQELNYLSGSIANLEQQLEQQKDRRYAAWIQGKLDLKIAEQSKLLNESAELELLEAPMEET